MEISKLPKKIAKKYNDKVLEKAIKKTDYDLAQNNKSKDDISEKKYEGMIARNIEVIKSSHKEKGWRYLSTFLGITFVSNILKGNIAGAFGFGDDDEDLDA